MGWLWAIIVGFVLGVIAKAVIPGKQQIPLWLTTVLGILGSIVGNAVAGALGIAETRGIDWGRHGLQLAGAILLVYVGDMLWVGMRRQKQKA
ncbi:GlsB/YeaQ/YmgE family stress response membrane protein [Streptomyces sannanensis]|uniref:GlsB/YeaQ/YmgE family stress response membrane protein n=1 Tax=Streptomyces sannanensis TaxID=285536 RepID=A0ABP6S795_9ACTN